MHATNPETPEIPAPSAGADDHPVLAQQLAEAGDGHAAIDLSVLLAAINATYRENDQLRITQYRAAQEIADTLQTSGQLLRQLLAQYPGILFWKDEAGLYQGCNPRFAELAGLETPETIVGKTDDELDWREAGLAEFFSAGEASRSDEPVSLPGEGSALQWLRKSLLPLQDAEGNPQGVLTVFTETRPPAPSVPAPAAPAAATTGTPAAATPGFTLTGMALCNREGVLTWANQTVANITGHKLETLPGQRMEDLLRGEEAASEALQSFSRAMQESRTLELDVLCQRQNGERCWVNIVQTPMHDDSGNINGFLVVMADLTRRKQQEQQLRLYQSIVTHADTIIMVTDTQVEDGPHLIYANPHFSNVTGYKPEGLRLDALEGPETSAETVAEWRAALQAGTPWHGEILNHTRSGETYWASRTMAPVRDEHGAVINFVVIESDISARKAAELALIERENELRDHRDNLQLLVDERTSELEEALKLAEKAKSLQSDFLANMSHEIRTPMNGIIGLAKLLSGTQLQDKQAEYIRAICDASQHLLTLVNDVLDISKIEAGELSFEYRPVNLGRLVDSVAGTMRAVCMEKNISLDVVKNFNNSTTFIVDSTRLGQVLNNLLSNAIKFTAEGGVRLVVEEAERTDKHSSLLFKVEDTGIGIAEDKLERIFNKFTQAEQSTTRQFGGTGLGLSIVKNIVEMMGGTIDVVSEPGKGSCFAFTLESDLGEMLSAETDTKSRRPLMLSDISVLVVDDHPINGMFARSLLQEWGIHNSEVAENGEVAVQKAKEKRYDMILMDCQMPVMDGFSATRAIRKAGLNRETPIVAMTADAMQGVKDKCIAAGMNDYITKPVDADQLQTIFASLLQQAGEPEEEEVKLAEPATPKQPAIQLPPVLDEKQVTALTRGKKTKLKEYLEIYLTQMRHELKELRMLLDSTDRSWNKTAHRMKGAAATLGAKRLAEAYHKAQFTDNPQQRRQVFAAIKQEVGALLEFYETL